MVELVQYRLVLCGTGSFSIGHGQYWLVLFGTGLFSIGQYWLVLLSAGLFSIGQYWLVLFVLVYLVKGSTGWYFLVSPRTTFWNNTDRPLALL